MAWIKHTAGYTGNPKLVKASDSTFRLWHEVTDHCNEWLTSGVVAVADVAKFANVRHTKTALKQAISIGLIHNSETYSTCQSEWCKKAPAPGETEVSIHDYLEFQPSKAEVEAERRKDRERKRAKRAGENPIEGVQKDTPPRVSGGRPATRPVPSRPGPSEVPIQKAFPPEPRAALSEEPPNDESAGIMDLGELAEVLSEWQQKLVMDIADRNPSFTRLSISTSQFERIKAKHDNQFLTDCLIELVNSVPPGPVEHWPAYFDEVADRLSEEAI